MTSDEDMIRRGDAKKWMKTLVAVMHHCGFEEFAARVDESLTLLDDCPAAPAVQVGVRALTWTMEGKGRWIGMPDPQLGQLAFWIFQDGDGRFKRALKNTPWLYYTTLEAAKSAAQADYEARIRSALTVQPVKVHEETNTPQRQAFWDWLPLAFRDGHIGDDPKFTKHNMQVAHLAGWQHGQAVQPAPAQAPKVARALTSSEIARIIESTECASMTKDGDKRWTRRIAEALAYRQYSAPPLTVQPAPAKAPDVALVEYAERVERLVGLTPSERARFGAVLRGWAGQEVAMPEAPDMVALVEAATDLYNKACGGYLYSDHAEFLALLKRVRAALAKLEGRA